MRGKYILIALLIAIAYLITRRAKKSGTSFIEQAKQDAGSVTDYVQEKFVKTEQGVIDTELGKIVTNNPVIGMKKPGAK